MGIRILWSCLLIAATYCTKHILRNGRIRLLKEISDINRDKLTLNDSIRNDSCDTRIRLYPVRNNIREWHFSFCGPLYSRSLKSSDFSNGLYHGKIVLDESYPQKGIKQIIMLTPNGRWEVGTDICLSITNHHKETWNSDWNLRTIVLALQDHMTSSPIEIGAISTSPSLRKQLAIQSRSWICPICHVDHRKLLHEVSLENSDDA